MGVKSLKEKIVQIKDLQSYFFLGVILLLLLVAVNNGLGGSNSASGNANANAGASPNASASANANANANAEAGASPQNEGRVLQASSATGEASVATQYTYSWTQEVINSLRLTISGSTVGTAANASGEQIEIRNNGAIGSVLSMTGGLYEQQPASVDVWAQNIRERASPQVVAQDSNDSNTYNPGQGFELL
ncbi:MAG: hypothetical protein ACOCXP_03655, partial [Candidatus Dojkabacteria bacterium]